DLLLENIRVFRDNPDVLRNYQRRFKYILVDEYQDTNVAQYLWLRLLAQAPSATNVGDAPLPIASPQDGPPDPDAWQPPDEESADNATPFDPHPADAMPSTPPATAELSAAPHQKNICCVGDDDQSIYGWRGAEVDNILRFDHDFPGAKVIRLERNYRS